jgi:nucleotide-binding universal stress UspA family protein
VKILLATDGSRHSKRVVGYFVSYLKLLGGKPELHVIHVRPPLPSRAAAALSRSIVRRYYSDETRKALAGAKRALDRSKVPYKEVHMIGDPGETIAGYAKRGKFDLVVLGSRGQGALSNLLLGSVASKVLAECKVPALIIR